MNLEVGQILKTNYDTGPYQVSTIMRQCNCTHIRDEIEGIEKPLPLHVHMSLRDLKNGGTAYLNYYDDETLESVDGSGDKLILLPNLEPIQRSLI